MLHTRLLLVDDDADDQLFFLDALNELGKPVNCALASNGQEALEKLSTTLPPDLIFLDLNMPVMDGFECLTELRKREQLKDVPVIIFTTTSDLTTIKRTHDLGANAFFKKPNEFSTMLVKLKKVLESGNFPQQTSTTFSFSEYSL